MTTFDDTGFHDLLVDVEETENDVTGSSQVIFKFSNGWGASVVQGPYTYGGPDGLFELAVLDSNGRLNYDTPVAPDDVLGYLTTEDVKEKLAQIANLTEAELTEFRTEKAKKEFLAALKYLSTDFQDVRERSPEAITTLPSELRSAVESIVNYFDNQEEDNA